MNELEMAASTANCKPETVEYIFNENSLAVAQMLLVKIHAQQLDMLIILAVALVFAVANGYFFLKNKGKIGKVLTAVALVFGLVVAGLATYGLLLKVDEGSVWEDDIVVSKEKLATIPAPTESEKSNCLVR